MSDTSTLLITFHELTKKSGRCPQRITQMPSARDQGKYPSFGMLIRTWDAMDSSTRLSPSEQTLLEGFSNIGWQKLDDFILQNYKMWYLEEIIEV